MEIKNKICYEPIQGSRGTVVSNALFDGKGKASLCNVIWDDGQHSTERIQDIEISEEINNKPPKW